MGQDTAKTGHDDRADILASDTRLTIKMPVDLARLMRRTDAVAYQVTTVLNQILDQHETRQSRICIEV